MEVLFFSINFSFFAIILIIHTLKLILLSLLIFVFLYHFTCLFFSFYLLGWIICMFSSSQQSHVSCKYIYIFISVCLHFNGCTNPCAYLLICPNQIIYVIPPGYTKSSGHIYFLTSFPTYMNSSFLNKLLNFKSKLATPPPRMLLLPTILFTIILSSSILEEQWILLDLFID